MWVTGSFSRTDKHIVSAFTVARMLACKCCGTSQQLPQCSAATSRLTAPIRGILQARTYIGGWPNSNYLNHLKPRLEGVIDMRLSPTDIPIYKSDQECRAKRPERFFAACAISLKGKYRHGAWGGTSRGMVMSFATRIKIFSNGSNALVYSYTNLIRVALFE